MKTRLVVLCRCFGSIAAILTAAGYAQDKVPPKTDYSQLTRALVSANQEPRIGIARITGPKDYDIPEQKRIEQVIAKLLNAGDAAFPALIDMVDDDRYSTTIGAGNKSVGEVCNDILHSHIQGNILPYCRSADKSQYLPRDYLRTQFEEPTAKNWKGWWDRNKDKSLATIQQEVLEWAMTEEFKVGFDSLESQAKVVGPLYYLKKKIDNDRLPLPPCEYAAKYDFSYPK